MKFKTNDIIVNHFFNFIRNWDNASKKNLIVKLSQTIDGKSKNNYDFSSCFGAWSDDRTADEIIESIYFNRINSNEIEKF